MEQTHISWPTGLKKTKQREYVLAVLENSEEPLSASDICMSIGEAGETAWLSTVYRTLDILVSKGVVTKTSVMNNDMALYELNRFKHKHYAVCTNCHKIIAMVNCPLEEFAPKLDDSAFQVLGHNLEIYGICGECGSK